MNKDISQIHSGNVGQCMRRQWESVGGLNANIAKHLVEMKAFFQGDDSEGLESYLQSNAFPSVENDDSKVKRYSCLLGLFHIIYEGDDAKKEYKEALERVFSQDISKRGRLERFAHTRILMYDFLGLGTGSDFTGANSFLNERTKKYPKCAKVLLRIIDETRKASVDPRGQQINVEWALQDIVDAGHSTLLSHASNLEIFLKNIENKENLLRASGCVQGDEVCYAKFVHNVFFNSMRFLQGVGLNHIFCVTMYADTSFGPEKIILVKKEDEIYAIYEPIMNLLNTDRTITTRYGVSNFPTGDKTGCGCPFLLIPAFMDAIKIIADKLFPIEGKA